MCFNTYSHYGWEAKPAPCIAKRNIPVYKVLDKDNLSPCKLMRDEKGNVMKWRKGYLYIELPNKDGEVFQYIRHWRIWWITKGLHSVKTKSMARGMCGTYRKIVKMYIPKGAKYYTNKDGYYVSDQLLYI